MSKGVRKELSLAEEILEQDRSLMASVRRNLELAEKIKDGTSDENLEATLGRLIARHPLTPKSAPTVTAKEKPTLTDKERNEHRVGFYLRSLTDSDIRNILELAKSMYRIRKGPQARRARKKAHDKAGDGNSPVGGEGAMSPDGNRV